MRSFAMALAAVACALAPAMANPPANAGKKPKPEPPSPQRIRADKLFEDGRRYLANKEYALACTAFEESQQADPAIGTQMNIALCYEQWGKLATAYRAYVEGERVATEKTDDRAKGARKKVEELGPLVPHLRFDVPASVDPSAVFLFDGKEIERGKLADEILVDPGHHTIEARVPGVPPRTAAFELAPGEHKRHAIDVPRPEIKVMVTVSTRKRGRLYGGVAAIAGGGVAAGVAGLVALAARQDYNDAIRACDGLNCESREAFDVTQTARKRANAMTFVGAGGLAVAGAGVYLVLTSRGQRTEERIQHVRVVPAVGPDGVGLAFGGAW